MIFKKIKSILNDRLSIWQKSWLITLLFHCVGLCLVCKNFVKEPVTLPNLKNYKYVSLVRVPNKNTANLTKDVRVKVNNKVRSLVTKSANGSKKEKNLPVSNNSSNRIFVNSKAESSKMLNKEEEKNIINNGENLLEQNSDYKQSDDSTLAEINNNADMGNNSADAVDGTLNERLYEAQIIKVIMQHWIKPLQLSKQDFCIWKVNLSLQGEVIKLKLVSSSNNENLEISSQEAIYAAQPFFLPNNEKEAAKFLELKVVFRDS